MGDVDVGPKCRIMVADSNNGLGRLSERADPRSMQTRQCGAVSGSARQHEKSIYGTESTLLQRDRRHNGQLSASCLRQLRSMLEGPRKWCEQSADSLQMT